MATGLNDSMGHDCTSWFIHWYIYIYILYIDIVSDLFFTHNALVKPMEFITPRFLNTSFSSFRRHIFELNLDHDPCWSVRYAEDPGRLPGRLETAICTVPPATVSKRGSSPDAVGSLWGSELFSGFFREKGLERTQAALVLLEKK